MATSKLSKILRAVSATRAKLMEAIKHGRMSEHVGLKGAVDIHAYDRLGRTTYKQVGRPNLLMYNERDILIELLGGILLGSPTYAQDNGGLAGDGNRRYLKWLAIGDDNTAPARTDTALGNELLMLNISDYGALTKSGNALQITATIPYTDGGDVDTYLNGQTLYEVGLFTIANDEDDPTVPGPTGNEVMFSRQVHPGIPKTSDIQVDYTYNVYFT